MALAWRFERVPARRALAGLVLLALAATGALVGGRWLFGAPDVAAVELDVVRRWPQIVQMPRQQMSRMLAAAPPDLVVFDVREADEHIVSHLPGAIRVDPDMSREDFLATHGKALGGKAVVFYCSVGVRSSILAARVREDLERGGTKGVFNLRGGLFGWHNDGRALVDARGATDQVHGYDSRWARLLQRQGLVRQ